MLPTSAACVSWWDFVPPYWLDTRRLSPATLVGVTRLTNRLVQPTITDWTASGASQRAFHRMHPNLRRPLLHLPMNKIQQQDPEVWARIAGEIERQRDGLEMIASENYTSPAVMQAVRQRADEQVRRGLSRPALLRRLRVRRRGRGPGPRPGQAALRRRARQRAAALAARRPTRPSIWRRWSRATRCWGSTWPTAGT